MKFKKLSINEQIYTEENLDDIIKICHKITLKHGGPLGDMNEKDLEKKYKRKNEYLIRDLITALSICHNVTPVYENDKKTLQASSPDEFALVSFAESLNFKLKNRDEYRIVITNSMNKDEEYDILACFPFSSETKRMGILVKHLESNKIIFYLKGADVIMANKVRPIYKAIVNDECDNLAREGLRTLVIGQKFITNDQYLFWKSMYDKACVSLVNRA